MVTKQGKKHAPLFSRGRPGTQEDCNRINNGGATQTVLNRRVKGLADKTDIKPKAPADNDNKAG
jgi:hypothetical protein